MTTRQEKLKAKKQMRHPRYPSMTMDHRTTREVFESIDLANRKPKTKIRSDQDADE